MCHGTELQHHTGPPLENNGKTRMFSSETLDPYTYLIIWCCNRNFALPCVCASFPAGIAHDLGLLSNIYGNNYGICIGDAALISAAG